METLKKEQFETQVEAKETKEQEIDPELLAAAQMERKDRLVEATKTGAQQIQSIAAHIASVQNTIAQIRASLGLSQNSADPSSIERDQQQIQKLQKKIMEYRDELIDIKTQELQKEQPELDTTAAQQQATRFIDQLLQNNPS